jgi:hypothetical protein
VKATPGIKTTAGELWGITTPLGSRGLAFGLGLTLGRGALNLAGAIVPSAHWTKGAKMVRDSCSQLDINASRSGSSRIAKNAMMDPSIDCSDFASAVQISRDALRRASGAGNEQRQSCRSSDLLGDFEGMSEASPAFRAAVAAWLCMAGIQYADHVWHCCVSRSPARTSYLA